MYTTVVIDKVTHLFIATLSTYIANRCPGVTVTLGRSSPPSGTTIDVNSSKNISCELCEVLAPSSSQRPTITWHLLNYNLISSLDISDGLFPGVVSVLHSSDGYESTLTFTRFVKEFDGAILTCSVDNRRISSFPLHFKGNTTISSYVRM